MARKKTDTPAVDAPNPTTEIEIVEAPNPMRDLIEKISILEERIGMDLSQFPPGSRDSLKGLVVQSQKELAPLLEQYNAMVGQGLALIFASGPGDGVFASQAEEEGGTLTANAAVLYETIARRIEPGMRVDRVVKPSQFSALLQSFESLRVELGRPVLRSPIFTGEVVCPTFEDLVTYVRTTIRATNGDNFAALGLRRDLVLQAREKRYSQSVVPAVVLGATAEEAAGLSAHFGGRTVAVDAPKDFSPALIRETFVALRAKLKKEA